MPNQQATAEIAIVLLAAGQSKRFGSNKMLARVNEQTLLQKAIATLDTLPGCDLLIVLGSDHQQLRALSGQHRVVICDQYARGMGHSIACGVSTLVNSAKPYRGIMISLADQIALDREHYLSLLSAFKKGPSIAAAQYSDRLGAPAIFAAPHWPALQALSGDKGARQLIEQTADVSPVTLPAAAVDIDTRQDLHRYLSR